MKKLVKPGVLILAIIITIAMSGCGNTKKADNSYGDISKSQTTASADKSTAGNTSLSLSKIPAYSGKAYITVNNGTPSFTTKQVKLAKTYQKYGNLDKYGRATGAIACIGPETLPTTKRGSIGMVKPSGWHLSVYDKSIIEDRYLYNRCHLIAYCLTGIDGSDGTSVLSRNLVTGTRYMNIEGQLPFETKTVRYIEGSKNHVLYRVTPVFKGNNLLCSGVHMEAQSIEDKGKGIKFNVYCYNVQPKITINYANGANKLSSDSKDSYNKGTTDDNKTATFIINKNSKIFHKPSCKCVKLMKESNKETMKKTKGELIKEGYTACKVCNP